MKNRWQIALSAGLLAAVWCGIADTFHLVTWVGFLGCSTYFAQPKTGFNGVIVSCCTNLSGVFWAWLVISASSYFDTQLMRYVFTGIITSLMCLQASYHKLSFIPGAFIGCCATFAMQGDIKALLPALIIGALLGYAMTILTAQFVTLTLKYKHIV